MTQFTIECDLTGYDFGFHGSIKNIDNITLDKTKFFLKKYFSTLTMRIANQSDDDICTELKDICIDNKINLAKYFLKLRANPNVKNKKDSTALKIAKSNGYFSIINLLEKAGAVE